MNGLDEQLAFRPKQAARAIGVSERQIYELIYSGELESLKVGTARLIRRQALVDFLDRKQAGT